MVIVAGSAGDSAHTLAQTYIQTVTASTYAVGGAWLRHDLMLTKTALETQLTGVLQLQHQQGAGVLGVVLTAC